MVLSSNLAVTCLSMQWQMAGMPSWFVPALTGALNAAFSQPPSLGAQPQLYAALSDDIKGGELVGPRFFAFGSPVFETTDFCQLSPKYDPVGSMPWTARRTRAERRERVCVDAYGSFCLVSGS